MNPIAKNEGLVIKELDNELLIYMVDTDKAYCLNETSAFVWKACDGTKSVDEISRLLSGKFDSPVSSDFVWLALDQLAKDGLLTGKPESRFPGMSRREVIRKVGLASAIAIPVVAMLSFPDQALAASCAASGCGTLSGDCGGLFCCLNPGGNYVCTPGGCTNPC